MLGGCPCGRGLFRGGLGPGRKAKKTNFGWIISRLEADIERFVIGFARGGWNQFRPPRVSFGADWSSCSEFPPVGAS